jgi:hypothetical protein
LVRHTITGKTGKKVGFPKNRKKEGISANSDTAEKAAESELSGTAGTQLARSQITSGALLEQHRPKVGDRVGQRRLRGNEAAVGGEVGVDVVGVVDGQLDARVVVGQHVLVPVLGHVLQRRAELGAQRRRQLRQQHKVLRNGRVVCAPRHCACCDCRSA